MTVMLRFPHRSTADPHRAAVDARGGRSAEIIILPCVRREPIRPSDAIADPDPLLLKA
jgi:hypothetical protein